MNHAHTHTYAWRSKRFDTYKHNNAINEFFYASHNQICLYGNVWGRCACCFLQPLPSKRTHAHMHTPIKIPTCCSVLFGEAAKRDDVLTVLLHHRAHTHTHAHTVCFCLSQPNKPMHKSIQFDYFNAVYILLTNQTFLSYDNFWFNHRNTHKCNCMSVSPRPLHTHAAECNMYSPPCFRTYRLRTLSIPFLQLVMCRFVFY